MAIGTPQLRGKPQHVLNNNTLQEVWTYLVTTDGTEAPAAIRDVSGIPAYYSVHPSINTMYVAGKRVNKIDTAGKAWEVEVEYQGELYGSPWPADIQDIVTRDAEYEWSTEETIESVDTDIYGNPIQNVCKEDYDPPVTDSIPYVSLTVSRNELLSEYSAAKSVLYVNHTNSGVFFGSPARSALCKRINARLQTKASFQYWRVTYTFWFNLFLPAVNAYMSAYNTWTQSNWSDYWGVRIANKARRQPKLGGASGTFDYEPIKDANGDPVTDPVPVGLDGLPITQQMGGTTVWLGFRRKSEANFAALGLE
jgi:hypothetical protein